MAVSDMSALDTIIRRVDSQLPDKRGQYYIAIGADSGEINPSIWSRIGGSETYIYRVFTEDAGQPPAQGESNILHVRDPETGDGVNLTITYQALCPKGNEVRLVKALGQSGSPSDEVRMRITGWARSYLFGKEKELFSNFGKIQDDLLNFICENAVKETGLNFRAQLHIQLGEDLSLYRVEEYVEVRFSDSQQRQNILVQCDLDFDPKLTLRAIVAYHRLPELHVRLVELVKEHFRHEVPAQAFVEGLRSPEIISGLRLRFDEFAVKDGRQVSNLTITPQGREHLPPIVYADILQEEVRPLGRKEPITLTSKIQLTIEDLAQYQAAQIANLQCWLQETFKAVIDDVCFEKKHLEYLQKKSWSSIEAAIKVGMEAKVKEIGYRVKQIFSKPVLKEDKYAELKLHRFLVKGLPFRSTSPVHFDLTVDATFSIPNWDDERLADKINQDIDLDSDITAELRHALSIVLAKVTPNDFILKFSKTEGDRPSIEKQLVDAVFAKLTDSYKAHVSFVLISQVDTDEIKRVREILNVPKDVEFTATPSAGEEVTFSLSWKISNIEENSWEIINRPSCNLEAIQNQLRSALSGTFSALDAEELRYIGEGARRELEEKASVAAHLHVERYFGLILSVSNFRRLRTGIEEEAERVRSEIQRARLEETRKLVQHEGKIRDLRREQELVVVSKAGELSSRTQTRMLELRGMSDRNRAQDAELADLEKALSPEMRNPLARSSSTSAGPADPALASDPRSFSDQFFSPARSGDSNPTSRKRPTNGPPTIERTARATDPSNPTAPPAEKGDAN